MTQADVREALVRRMFAIRSFRTVLEVLGADALRHRGGRTIEVRFTWGLVTLA